MTRARDVQLETIQLEQTDRVLTAWYSRPPLNFATSEFLRDLDLLTHAVDRDDSVGAVILTGGVEGRFLTHADPTELADAMQAPLPSVGPRTIEPMWRIARTLFRLPGLAAAIDKRGGSVGKALVWGYRWRTTTLRMNRSSAVYIAAINGPTTGGGHEIVLACDLRFVSDAPHIRLGQIEILAGLIPGGGGTQRLPKMIGTARALEHMLDGAPLTAQQALDLGLVTAIVPDGNLIAHCRAEAQRFSRRSPLAVQAIKRLVYFSAGKPLKAGLDPELAAFLATGISPAVKATLPAFTADLEAIGDSPLSTASESWVDGTRVDHAGG